MPEDEKFEFADFSIDSQMWDTEARLGVGSPYVSNPSSDNGRVAWSEDAE